MKNQSIVICKTPNGRHRYRATCKGYGCFGWGNTPAEARAMLAENMAAEDADRQANIADQEKKRC